VDVVESPSQTLTPYVGMLCLNVQNVCVCMYVCMHIHIYMYVYTYVYMYVCIYVYVYMYTERERERERERSKRERVCEIHTAPAGEGTPKRMRQLADAFPPCSRASFLLRSLIGTQASASTPYH
jgi:hypothetical protein